MYEFHAYTRYKKTRIRGPGLFDGRNTLNDETTLLFLLHLCGIMSVTRQSLYNCTDMT
jgi:hypothetical protein